MLADANSYATKTKHVNSSSRGRRKLQTMVGGKGQGGGEWRHCGQIVGHDVAFTTLSDTRPSSCRPQDDGAGDQASPGTVTKEKAQKGVGRARH